MMQVALGEDTWAKGIFNYLDTMQQQAATPEDLYAALQRAVDEDHPINPPNVATIMRTWEQQPGYPVITLTRDGDQLTFTQERFFYSNVTSDALWWVPITYITETDPDFTKTQPDFWIEGEQTVVVPSAAAPKQWGEDDWIIVNVQENSYYRVNYDEHTWDLIEVHLNGIHYDDIHILNRAQLVDDSLNLARAGRADYATVFGILEYLYQEHDYVPWSAVSL